MTSSGAMSVTCTSRPSGIGGRTPVIPNLIAEMCQKGVIKEGAMILDFGAGKIPTFTRVLQEGACKRMKVVPYDIDERNNPIHTPDALSRKYDVVFASNVLNVADDTDWLQMTVGQLQGALKSKSDKVDGNDGLLVLNYPEDPRKCHVKEWNKEWRKQGKIFPSKKSIVTAQNEKLVNDYLSPKFKDVHLAGKKEWDSLANYKSPVYVIRNPK